MDETPLRESVQAMLLRVRSAVQALLSEVRRLAAPVLALWARFAIERWERVRATFGDHPDLVETDRWLDRWYSFGAA